MCGRFAFHSPRETVVQLFALPDDAAELPPPRWNVAPTQEVAAVRVGGAGGRELARLHWGLVPGWAKDRAIGNRMINARAETLTDKPAFRNAFRRRRCLVLADGWYEWQASAHGKQPWYVHAADDQPFGMAGVWESWRDPARGECLESCAIVTTGSTDPVCAIHERMPLVIPRERYGEWLDPANADPARLAALLTPAPGAALLVRPVSRRVNSPANEGPELVERVDAEAAPGAGDAIRGGRRRQAAARASTDTDERRSAGAGAADPRERPPGSAGEPPPGTTGCLWDE